MSSMSKVIRAALAESEAAARQGLGHFYERSDALACPMPGLLDGPGAFAREYALFGWLAYALLRESTDRWLVMPVIRGGRAFGCFPDEGATGILHVFFLRPRRRWVCSYLHCPHVRLSGLEAGLELERS